MGLRPLGHLSSSMQADVAGMVDAMDMDIREFRFEQRSDPQAPGLLKRPPRFVYVPDRTFYFEFRFSEKWQTHTYTYAPASGSLEYRVDKGVEWYEVLRAVAVWLGNLQRELAVEDPWSALGREEAILSLPEGASQSEPFSRGEQEYIRRQIETYVQQSPLEQDHPTRAEFEELKRAVEVLSRRGWISMAGGIAINLTRLGSNEEAVAFYHEAVRWAQEAARLLGS